MSFPVTVSVTIKAKGGVSTLSDILFLAVKENDGKLRTDEGFLSATGDLATLTAASGKDMYIARAQVTFFNNGGGTLSTGDTVELKLNGTVIETAIASLGASTTSTPTHTYTFKNIGQKVAASQIIKLEVTVLSAFVDVEGFIEVWEENTGADPAI